MKMKKFIDILFFIVITVALVGTLASTFMYEYAPSNVSVQYQGNTYTGQQCYFTRILSESGRVVSASTDCIFNPRIITDYNK